MAYSQWVLRSECKKFYIHTDRVHSTFYLSRSLRFTSFAAAENFAKEKRIEQVFSPVLYRECKEKGNGRKRG